MNFTLDYDRFSYHFYLAIRRLWGNYCQLMIHVSQTLVSYSNFYIEELSLHIYPSYSKLFHLHLSQTTDISLLSQTTDFEILRAGT